VQAVHQPLTMLQWADCFVLQQWLIIRLWVSCLTHDLLNDSSAADFMRVSYAIQIADTVLEWCSLLDQRILEAHGTGMCERLFDIAMAVVMKVQGSGTSPTSYDDHVLEGYFKLLGKLRGGAHPFLEALEVADKSVRLLGRQNP